MFVQKSNNKSSNHITEIIGLYNIIILSKHDIFSNQITEIIRLNNRLTEMKRLDYLTNLSHNVIYKYKFRLCQSSLSDVMILLE